MQAAPSRRARKLALLPPLLGLFLLMPPFVTLFVGAGRPFGVPLIVVYLFGTWIALIVAAAWLARGLDTAAADDAPPPAAADPAPRS